MSNLELWESVQKTDPNHTKKAKMGGMTITAIDPQYQRKNATEKFGPFGIGWGVEDEDYHMSTHGDTVLCRYTATMWYLWNDAVGKVPIQGVVKASYMTNGSNPYLKVDDEYAKKVATDALTKGLSTLGFNADVFLGLFDDNKYVNQMKKEFKKPEPAKEVVELTDEQIKGFKAEIESCATVDEAKILWGKVKSNNELVELIKTKAGQLKEQEGQ